MALLGTPRQLTHRSEFYHQLASLTAAGLTLIQGLTALLKSPPAASYRKPLTRMLEFLNRGATFTESVAGLGRWMPAFDVALIEAGEQSGRIDQVLRLLSEHYGEQARLAREVLGSVAYPAFLVLFALLIFPVDLLSALVWKGEVGAYVIHKLVIGGSLAAVIGVAVYALQSRHGERWRRVVETTLKSIPLVGAARRDLALARLSAALEGLISAGVSMADAWELSAAASGSPALGSVVRHWRSRLEAGQTPAELVSESAAFPELFGGMYRTAELSGQLDVTLRRLYLLYQEAATRRLRLIAEWAPRIVIWMVMLAVAYKIISFYAGYFQTLNKVMTF